MASKKSLVGLLLRKSCWNNSCSDKGCNQCDYIAVSDDAIEQIANYLIECEEVIVPPVPLGTRVFVIPTKENGLEDITEFKVLGFAIDTSGKVMNCFRVRGTSALFQPAFEEFGKTVFSSKDDALKCYKWGGWFDSG